MAFNIISRVEQLTDSDTEGPAPKPAPAPSAPTSTEQREQVQKKPASKAKSKSMPLKRPSASAPLVGVQETDKKLKSEGSTAPNKGEPSLGPPDETKDDLQALKEVEGEVVYKLKPYSTTLACGVKANNKQLLQASAKGWTAQA